MTKLQQKQMAWICYCLEYRGDVCLIWPFYRLKGGYGKTARFHHEQYLIHRLICELVNGPAPTPDHEAAHSCGCGAHGCATSRHLSWKTPSENRLDKRNHGTWWMCGSKLDFAQVREIRRISNSKTQRDVAAQFGVSQATISLVLNKKVWTHPDIGNLS